MKKNIQLSHADHECTGIKFPICYLVNNMDVPMNVGSIFRNADALGIEKVYLTGNSVVPPIACLLYTSPSPRDATLSRMPSSA